MEDTEFEFRTDEPERFDLLTLAKRHGQLSRGTVACDCETFGPHHKFAAVINRWTAEENRTGQPTMLTDDEYLAAIEAAKNGKRV